MPKEQQFMPTKSLLILSILIAGGMTLHFAAQIYEYNSYLSGLYVLASLVLVAAVYTAYSSKTTWFNPIQVALPLLAAEMWVAPVVVVLWASYQADWLMSVGDRVDLYAEAYGLFFCWVQPPYCWLVDSTPRAGRPYQEGGQQDRWRARQEARNCSIACLQWLWSARHLLAIGDRRGARFRAICLRRVANAGTGFVQICMLAGCLGIIAKSYEMYWLRVNKLRDKLQLAALLVVSAASFALHGYRGGLVYPFGLWLITKVVLTPRLRSMVYILPLMGLALPVVDLATGAVRTSLSTGRDVVDVLSSARAFPRSLDHVELMGAILRLERDGMEIQPTLQASLTNWIPRFLKPDKPLTTGPVLVAHLNPQWVSEGQIHTSSYTTGPIIELYVNGGIAFMCFGMAALGATYRWLATRMTWTISDMRTLILVVMLTYLLGWNLWLDDLGGAVNKLALFAAVWLVVQLSVGERCGGPLTLHPGRKCEQMMVVMVSGKYRLPETHAALRDGAL